MLTLLRGRPTWIIAALAALVVAMLSWQPAGAYPPQGFDDFDSAATVTFDGTCCGNPTFTFTAAGPTKIHRSDPGDKDGDTKQDIQTEIVSMELRGLSPIGPITVRESPPRRSTGEVEQQVASTDFLADSFFDVFVEIDTTTPLGTLHNEDPIKLSAVINALPPLQATYTPPVVIGVNVYDASGTLQGQITHAQHFVGQDPSFSVAPGGPSALLPADIFDVPTVLSIPATSLSLDGAGAGTDDVDGLSYGIDYVYYNADLRFSVDPAATGAPGTAVLAESSKIPAEAHGDEFRVVPPLPVGGGNVQILDENGSSAPPFPLAISDDVDALNEQPDAMVDPSGDGFPEFPVYFSLDPTSASLAGIPAVPADILVNPGGGPPAAANAVFIAAGALGLVAGAPGCAPPVCDDIDAFCLDATTSTVLFSLAPGSPSIGAGSAADVFISTPPGPPALFAPAAALGLLPGDNLNALKCTKPLLPVGGIGELPGLAGAAEGSAAPSGDSGWSAGAYAGVAAGIAAAALALGGGAWYARRRWLS